MIKQLKIVKYFIGYSFFIFFRKSVILFIICKPFSYVIHDNDQLNNSEYINIILL